MTHIRFKVAAKTDVGLVRTNNEDNFQVSWDLSALPMRWVNNEIRQLGKKGCLLVVADGMGGANAGEIASQIAIDTIKSKFVPEEITEKVISSTESINGFIKESIIAADRNIKNFAEKHPETKGMGTTIVIAWIIDGKLYIGWCGDSRAYLYNHIYGLIRLTKDHSYVQQLVDSGKLSEDEAFDFPDSNIITRCLSASTQKCHPETLPKPVVLSNDDIVLLCTDGLCGMMRDREISSTLKNFDGNVTSLSENLVSGAINASGADNITLCLFYAISGLKKATPARTQIKKTNRQSSNLLFGGIVAIIIIIILLLWLFLRTDASDDSTLIPSEAVSPDSIITRSDSTAEDSLQKAQYIKSPFEKRLPEAEETDSSLQSSSVNGKNPLDGLSDILLPKAEEMSTADSEEVSTADSEDEPEMDSISTPDVMVVKMPAGKEIRLFLLENYGMNKSHFEKLNPGIDFGKVKAGDNIKVYKIIASTNEQ